MASVSMRMDTLVGTIGICSLPVKYLPTVQSYSSVCNLPLTANLSQVLHHPLQNLWFLFLFRLSGLRMRHSVAHEETIGAPSVILACFRCHHSPICPLLLKASLLHAQPEMQDRMPEPVATMCCPSSSIPALHPRCLLPKRYPKAGVQLAFLKRIDHVEISSVEEFRGVTYYVVDVYLKHITSRIPTNLFKTSPTTFLSSSKNKNHRKQRSKHLNASDEHNELPEPDFKIVRRFTSFDELRAEILQYCTQEPIGLCSYCDKFRLFLFHCYNQPRTFVKLFAGRTLRKHVLSEFLNRAITLAIGLESNGRRPPGCLMCVGYEAIPRLVDRFIRRDMSVIERTQMLHH